MSILFGAYVPLILRPLEVEHRLIGEAYVDGIMYGEAIRDHHQQQKPEALLRIR